MKRVETRHPGEGVAYRYVLSSAAASVAEICKSVDEHWGMTQTTCYVDFGY